MVELVSGTDVSVFLAMDTSVRFTSSTQPLLSVKHQQVPTGRRQSVIGDVSKEVSQDGRLLASGVDDLAEVSICIEPVKEGGQAVASCLLLPGLVEGYNPS